MCTLNEDVSERSSDVDAMFARGRIHHPRWRSTHPLSPSLVTKMVLTQGSVVRTSLTSASRAGMTREIQHRPARSSSRRHNNAATNFPIHCTLHPPSLSALSTLLPPCRSSGYVCPRSFAGSPSHSLNRSHRALICHFLRALNQTIPPSHCIGNHGASCLQPHPAALAREVLSTRVL